MPDDYESERQERLKRNAAKLEELQLASAASEAQHAAGASKQQRAAELQAARDRVTAPAGPRRASHRAATARTASKLQQQARSFSSESWGASDSDASSSGGVRRPPAVAAEEYDPLDDMHSESSESVESLADSGASGGAASPPAKRRAPAARARTDALGTRQRPMSLASHHDGGAGPGLAAPHVANEAEEDAELQQALALSLAEAGGAAAPPASGGRPPSSVQAHSAAQAAQQPPATQAGSKRQAADPEKKPKRKGPTHGRQDKRKRGAVGAAPPSEEDVLAAFELFNRQGMSAIIASDIDKVASDTLGVDLEPVQLHNMMARACELLQLQQPRLTLADFTRMTRHFCG